MPGKRPPPIPPAAATAKRPPPVPLAASKRRIAGKYELVEVAGRGGMSTVWRAHQHGPGRFLRTVAVKHMLPALAEKPLYREMFFEEARIGAALHDPNIAQVYDFLVEKDNFYLVLEWVEGIDWFTYIDYIVKYARRRTRWELAVAIGIGTLRGLAAAHERVTEDGQHEPIIHRDVTPHNVLISEHGSAKLIDFGLSLAHDRVGEKTDPGIAKGKLAYLAPELVLGERPTPHSDQFAAGCALWEALAGRRAFKRGNPFEMMRRIAQVELPSLRKVRPDVPRELAAVVHRALAREPARRFPSVREMACRLGDVLKGATHDGDLYAALAGTVREARTQMGLGRRTQGVVVETPAPEDDSGLVELPGEDAEGVRGWLPALLRQLKR